MFDAIRELMKPPESSRTRIGFHREPDDRPGALGGAKRRAARGQRGSE